MNSRKIIVISTLTVALFLTVIATASATYTFKYYRLECPTDDVDVFSDVTIIAKTNDWRVDEVTFYWFSPAGLEFVDGPIEVNWVGGEWIASSTYEVDVLGEWTVKAKFQGGEDTCWWSDDVCKIKCCRFNVIPEVPLLGTIGASVAMMSGFAFKIKRKPKK